MSHVITYTTYLESYSKGINCNKKNENDRSRMRSQVGDKGSKTTEVEDPKTRGQEERNKKDLTKKKKKSKHNKFSKKVNDVPKIR